MSEKMTGGGLAGPPLPTHYSVTPETFPMRTLGKSQSVNRLHLLVGQQQNSQRPHLDYNNLGSDVQEESSEELILISSNTGGGGNVPFIEKHRNLPRSLP